MNGQTDVRTKSSIEVASHLIREKGGRKTIKVALSDTSKADSHPGPPYKVIGG